MSSDNPKYHTQLAGYFSSKPLYLDVPTKQMPNVRKLVEQPWQQTKGEMWDEVTETLCDVFFIETRARVSMLDLQQEDYAEAFSLIPDSDNKNSLFDFYRVFIQQKHILKDYPELTFQQLYNDLQWYKGTAKSLIDDSKKEFLSRNRLFLYQFLENYNPESRLIMTFSGHSNDITCCAFSRDNKRIISASKDYSLRIWSVLTGGVIKILEGHNHYVNCCDFSPDGKNIISGSYDKTLKIWDAETGNTISTLTGHTDVITSCAYSNDGKHIISGSKDKTIKLWDSDTHKELVTLTGHAEKINCVSFSPDNKKILSAGGDSTHGELKLWNTDTFKEIMTLAEHDKENHVSIGLQGIIVTIDGVNNPYDPDLFKKMKPRFAHCNEILTCSFSQDGTMIVTGEKTRENNLKIWDTKTGKIINSFNADSHAVNSCSFSHDNNKIVTGGWDKTIKIWDLSTGKEITSFITHTEAKCCNFSWDDKYVISGIGDSIKLWDANIETTTVADNIIIRSTNNSISHRGRVNSCTFSYDGKFIISAGPDDTHNNAIIIWDTNTGRCKITLQGHEWPVNSCSFSPDNRLIISGSDDKTIILWDAKTGRKFNTIESQIGGVSSCSFSPDGRWIVYAGGETLKKDFTLRLCESDTCTEIAVLNGHSSYVDCCAFSPDGKRIASGSKDCKIIIWDSITFKKTSTLEGHDSWVNYIAFSPDGKKLVSASGQNIRIWDIERNKELLNIAGHKDIVTSCSFSSDNQWIISGSIDKTIKIWNTETGEELTTFVCNDKVYTSSISASNRKIACWDMSGVSYLLRHEGAEIETPFITGVRIWSFNSKTNSWEWDKDITASCPYCGIRFPCSIPDNVTYEDDRLLTMCPSCGEKLKFNPFIVDNKGKKIYEKKQIILKNEIIKPLEIKIIPEQNPDIKTLEIKKEWEKIINKIVCPKCKGFNVVDFRNSRKKVGDLIKLIVLDVIAILLLLLSFWWLILLIPLILLTIFMVYGFMFFMVCNDCGEIVQINKPVKHL